ncbi:MAG: bifunctional hydroxymethylpyrimidine kinase/phosphomethylpyrimidine kinase [Rickettsiales bacterium]|nr:bifunctional hydroxymethylpyrimidine kinase/phosphomethylpyrimidine kinase [Rickettsiales bacterium]
MPTIPRILIIAGSDSSGGAGIQADIKTVTTLGGYAMTAITAVTAQNTLGVQAIEPIAEHVIEQQILSVLDDIGVDAIKIGMLHSASVIDVVASALKSTDVPIVLDPVMVATSGDVLLKPDAIEILKHRLIPMATLMTPNIPEAEQLVGAPIPSVQAMPEAAVTLKGRFGVHVLLKGGHMEAADQVTDLLVSDDGVMPFQSEYLDTHHTHGTGCTLSSAIATQLGRGKSLPEAVELARNYVHEAIKTAPEFGKGHGPLNHLHPLT